jgi:hypothetical protein
MPMGKDEQESIEWPIPDDVMRRKIQEAYDDPRPDIPAKEAFESIKRHHAERMKAKNGRRPA